MRLWKNAILCLLLAACLLCCPFRAQAAQEGSPDYALTAIDGSILTPATNPGITKLFIFTHLDPGHENALIRTLLDAAVEQPGNKLIIGNIVAAMATLAAGAFLIFWKRRK